MKLCKLKCDRCGNEFEESNDKDVFQIRFESELRPGHIRMYDIFEEPGRKLDTCRFCTSSFSQWWNAT